MNDAEAFLRLGNGHFTGQMVIKSGKKAFELWTKAAELGSVNGYYALATTYWKGIGVEEDEEKAVHYFELAAVGGHERSRHILGMMEVDNGNVDRSMKHFIIAASSGHDESLKKVGEGYKDRYVSKDDYAKTLRAYQVSLDEMKSERRMKATKISDQIKSGG